PVVHFDFGLDDAVIHHLLNVESLCAHSLSANKDSKASRIHDARLALWAGVVLLIAGIEYGCRERGQDEHFYDDCLHCLTSVWVTPAKPCSFSAATCSTSLFMVSTRTFASR